MLRFLSTLLLGCLLSTHLLAADPTPTEEQAAEPEPVLQGGLLGALADGLDSAAQELDLDAHLVDAWRLRTDRAAKEVERLVDRHSASDSLQLAGNFLLLTFTWAASFAALTSLGRWVARRTSGTPWLRERKRASSLLGYLLPYTLPALASLPLTLYASRFLDPSVARALGLSLAYATSSGLFSTSIILCLITLFDAGHKRPAVAVIKRLAPRLLFLIGFLAAWSDALTSPQIARQLGGNITASIAVLTGLTATFIFASLVIRLRRPVAHLIRNRSLKDRVQHRAVQETLRIFSAVWYLPILLMILVSAIHLVGAGEESQKALQKALLTTVLLVSTVFLSTLLQHLLAPRESDPAQRVRPYKELLRSLAHALLRIAMAVAFISTLR